MSSGRGGAGNVRTIEPENARISIDLEANQAAAASHGREPLPSDYLNREEQQYALSGRGGAGNYYSPKELSQTGRFSSARTGTGSGSAPQAQGMTEQSRTYGRGGAGNHYFGERERAALDAEKRRQEDQFREKLKQDIERGVKEHLAMPPKAKLPAGEPY